MTLLKCDICEEKVKDLITLNESAQSEYIKEVCGDCIKEINKFDADIREILYTHKWSWIKKFIEKLHFRKAKYVKITSTK